MERLIYKTFSGEEKEKRKIPDELIEKHSPITIALMLKNITPEVEFHEDDVIIAIINKTTPTGMEINVVLTQGVLIIFHLEKENVEEKEWKLWGIEVYK